MMSKFVQVFVIFYFITITSSKKSNQTLTKLNFLHLFSPDIVLEEPKDILEKAVQWLNEQSSSNVDIIFTMESFMVQSTLNATTLVANQTDIVAILDGTSSVISRNIFDITKHLSTVHMAYTPFAKHVDISTEKVIFNEYPSTDSYGINMCTLLWEFKWYNIVLITEHKLLEFSQSVKYDIEFNCEVNIASIRVYNESVLNGNIFSENIVVYLMFMSPANMKDILCEAYIKELGYPNTMFILPYWYNPDIIKDVNNHLCNSNQLQSMLEKTLAVRLEPSVFLNTNEGFFTFNESDFLPKPPQSQFTKFALEAIKVVSYAVSLIDKEISQKNKTLSGPLLQQYIISNLTNKLFDLPATKTSNQEQCHYFDNDGSISTEYMNVYQYKNGNYVYVAFINGSSLVYTNNNDKTTVLSGIIKFVPVHLAIIATAYIFAFLGIIFTTICLFFNIIFRNKKILKLSSPKLNYLIIVGSYWLYINVYFIVFPGRENNPMAYEILCIIDYTVLISVSLCDGTIQGKMFRIFYIFRNPSPTKKKITDWHIAGYVTILVTIDVIILVITMGHPLLRPQVFPYPSVEHPIETNLLGVNTTYMLYGCTSINIKYSVIRFSAIYIYRSLLDIITAILAILSCCHISNKAVNDAKSIIAIVYINVIITVSQFILFLTVAQYHNPKEIISCLSLIGFPTGVLVFTFVPKVCYVIFATAFNMIAVYKDPEAKLVFSITFTSLGRLSQKTKSTIEEKSIEI